MREVSIGIDKPFPLSHLEIRWIKAFCLHIKKFVMLYPERFEAYTENRFFETYRRQVFVFWMHKSAENQHAADRQQNAAILEYRQLVKRREELTRVACNDDWNPQFYE